MLHVPSANDYKWKLSSQQGVRPAAAYGHTITPGNNVMGTYVQLISGASLTDDVYFVVVNINSNAVSAAIRDALVDIGVDPAGGTSYTVKIPYLMGSSAAPYNVSHGGQWYGFPLRIQAGSSIAARAQVNNATVGTMRVLVWVYGQPRRPETTRTGTFVRSFGEVTATSRGTLVTPGTTAEGAWTQLGVATTEPMWWWQLGYGTADTTMTAAVQHADLGAGSAAAKKVIMEDQQIIITAAEQISNPPFTLGSQEQVATGDIIYGRLQSSAAADTSVSMMAYGLG